MEEVEVSTITGCHMSGEKDPYSQIDFSNIKHILDFSSLYSSRSKTVASSSKNLPQQIHKHKKPAVQQPAKK